jgi:hypothetical protein
MSRAFLFSIAMTAAVLIPAVSPAQDQVQKRSDAQVPKVPGGGLPAEDVARLEARIKALESRVAREESTLRNNSSDGAVVFLYGAFCALWAKNTGRSAWLWFFMGLLFSVFTVIVLLSKNSEDQKRRLGWDERSGV